MQTAVLLVLQLLAFGAVAFAAVVPAGRRRAGVLLLLIAVGSLVAAGIEGETLRSLKITHQFSAYVGTEIRPKQHFIESVEGVPGYTWGGLCAGFCLVWAAWALITHRSATASRVFGAPLLLAWSGCALQLALEKAAAPPGLLEPFDLAPDRVLLPASIAGALLLARPGRKILHLVFYLSLFLAVTRLPLAVFGTLATQSGWGTQLDVHATDFIVPPGSGRGVEVAGEEQLFWLVWAPHLIVFPALYMMSTGGLAFLALMWKRQQAEDRRTASPS